MNTPEILALAALAYTVFIVLKLLKRAAPRASARPADFAPPTAPESACAEFNEAMVSVYDTAGILRVRLGCYSEKPYISRFGASSPAMPPLLWSKPASRNCINCGAPANEPVCGYCGTEH